MSSNNPVPSTGLRRRAAIPQIPARSPTGSRASSSPAPRSRCAFTWTPAARNSTPLEGLTPSCYALAPYATYCAPRATRSTFRGLPADTSTLAGGWRRAQLCDSVTLGFVQPMRLNHAS